MGLLLSSKMRYISARISSLMMACILSLSTLEKRQILMLKTSLAKSKLTELVFVKQEMEAP